MKLRVAAILAALVISFGCGKDDPNKNLKPVDPNAKPPEMGTENPDGGKKKGEGPAPVAQ